MTGHGVIGVPTGAQNAHAVVAEVGREGVHVCVH